MAQTNAQVDLYMEEPRKWKEEINALRRILLDSGLVETYKWKKPCYTYDSHPVVIIYDLKDTAGIGFWKGSLMKDPKNILIKPGENSQAVRMIKFTNVKDILSSKSILADYIQEALAIEKAGLKVDTSKSRTLAYVTELQQKIDQDPAFKAAFEGLTPGRRRAYNIYFSSAKQSATRIARIDKLTPRILAGKGMNDRD